MANTKSKPKTNKKPQTAKEISEKKELRTEVKSSIMAVVFFATTLLLVLSVYVNVLGIFGNIVFVVMHSLFGYASYIIPLFTLWIGIDFLRETRKIKTTTRLWAGLILTVCAAAVCYLFENADFFEMYTFGSFFTKGIVDMLTRAGGVIGGFIAYPMICFITKTGFAILILSLVLICSLTFFDLTLLQIWVAIKALFADEEKPKEKKPEKLRVEVMPKPDERAFKDIDVDIGKNEPEIIIDAESDEPEFKPFTSFPIFVEGEEEHSVDFDSESKELDLSKPKKAKKAKKEVAEPEPSQFEDAEQKSMYIFPPKSLLETPKATGGITRKELEETERILIQTLADFGIEARMVGAAIGPIVTRYEISPSKGVRISKITALIDNIALNLAATSIRMEAPIPGKAAIGIEVPNKKKSMVFIKELLDSDEFVNSDNPLTVALGKDISGKLVYGDLSDMPHLLVAGATGSGKSVCINTILISLLYKASPEDVKLILIDPKVVELEVYNKIPHLIVPVVSNPKKAAGALQWAVNEMERRYGLFFNVNARNIAGYNLYAEKHPDVCEKMPQIVIVIDELADLMMTCAKEVEDYIVRLCQKARAAGIYLIIATQRPSVNVVTGLIKANVPSRIAFAVTSQVDSRVILDGIGAEKLLGKGDMLFKGRTMGSPLRIQCCFVSDGEVESVVEYIKKYSGTAQYDESANAAMENYSSNSSSGASGDDEDDDDLDEMFWPAVEFVIESGKASTSNLQRKFKLGYSRAARIIDIMEEKDIIGPYEGSKPRQVKMTMAEYQEAMVRR